MGSRVGSCRQGLLPHGRKGFAGFGSGPQAFARKGYERRSLAVAVSKQQSALAVTQNRPVVRRSLVIRVSYANSTSHREGSLAGAMLKGPRCHAVLTGS